MKERHIMSAEERKNYIHNVRKQASVLLLVADRMDRGEPESSACAAENVSVRKFRTFARSNMEAVKLPEYTTDVSMNNSFYSWKEAFLFAIFHDNSHPVLPDFDAAFDWAISSIPERERMVLIERFQNERTLDDIAESLGLTKQSIRQLEQKALRRLQYPKRTNAFMYGLEYAKTDTETEELQRTLNKNTQLLTQAYTKLSRLKKQNQACEAVLDEYHDFTNQLQAKYPDIMQNSNPRNLEEIQLDDVEMSTRAHNCLKWAGIKTMKDLERFKNEDDILYLRNVGQKTRNEILDIMSRYGIGVKNG